MESVTSSMDDLKDALRHSLGKKIAQDKATSPEEHAEKVLSAPKAHKELAREQALQLQMVMPAFSVNLNQLQSGIAQWMQHQGFWESDNKGEKLALIHSEVSETLEAVRKGDTENEVEELADIVIRVLDYAGYFGFDLAAAIHTKMHRNYLRPYKHGKAF